MCQLKSLSGEKVYTSGEKVVAPTWKSDYHIMWGHNANEPTYVEVDSLVQVWARRDLNP